MSGATILTLITIVADLVVIVGIGSRVVLRHRPVGVTLAWLIIIIVAPFVGAVIYLLVGEPRLGERRFARVAELRAPFQEWVASLADRSSAAAAGIEHDWVPLNRLVRATTGLPALAGNRIELFSDSQEILSAIRDDIDSAERFVHLEFFIWAAGGTVDEVADALERAARRGVVCRLLLDAVGSSDFLVSDAAARLRDAGVEIVAGLPVGLLPGLVTRADHRLHRKIVVIDGQVGWTGSLNMVDPRYFKQSAGVGQWIDAMVRIRGPAVEPLGAIFLGDWEIETGAGIETIGARELLAPAEDEGETIIQVVPSGPGYAKTAIHELLLATIYSAREELILTTPYFVPDDAIITALVSAANRGVAVTVILPARIDSVLVRHASRAEFGALLAAGVQIASFAGGLLHTKSITVDGELAVFGSVNLDMRSFWLNFEISLAIYDAAATATIRELQQRYLADSSFLDLDAWRARPGWRRLLEGFARLLGPVL
jgi:cardiolipin synthase